jgi:hypothetical protein
MEGNPMLDYDELSGKIRTTSNALSGLATLINNNYGTGPQIKDILESILEDLDDVFEEVERALD